MKRLTEKRDDPLVMSMWAGSSKDLKIYNRLSEIEDILGDEYNIDRLRELVEADRDGRCIVIPDFVWKVGETRGVIKVPYKSWMGRFMGKKFYKTEKEAKEAALKVKQNGRV